MKTHKEIESEIAETITLGRLWGMSEDEIKQCLLEFATIEEDGSRVKGKKMNSVPKKTTATAEEERDSLALSALKWVWFIVKVMVLVPVCIVIVLGCVYSFTKFASEKSPAFDNLLGRVTLANFFPIQRQVRRILKPTAETLGLSFEGTSIK